MRGGGRGWAGEEIKRFRGEENVLFFFSGSMSDPSAWVAEQGRELGGQRRFPPLLLNVYNLQHNLV